ncbi:MAG: polysaccharide pyruvyl transferase family protein [Erysipelotrichaceae bacterium]
MKKIGVLTLHGADNFGAVLQNFALQQAIIILGYSSETIDYCIPEIEKEYQVFSTRISKNPLTQIKRSFWEFVNYKQAMISKKKYNDFRKNYLRISEKRYNHNNICEAVYDIFICGSDQVWNKNIIRENNKDVFDLSFTNRMKASYGASCGSIKSLIDRLNYIENFSYITVRENELHNFLKQKGIESTVVCDPTLLIKKEQWEVLIKDINIEHSNYIYLYYIDDGREDAAKIAKYIASKINVMIINSKKYDYLSLKNKYGVNTFSDGPLDFLKKIESSTLVVVSSFHGTVFSILFEKQFVVILHKHTGTRVQTLLRKLGLEDRIFIDFDDFINRESTFKKIDYSKINITLNEWRKESLEELRKICEL